ncbi:toxin-antitoxin system YwqK family antitoxin [Fusobacterium sp. PH5-44]|uniref:toxin-antitoxin system YwqK family antitoxin n=1 Tax=unclassified Fusobacterium TaxID=2648384 RepID=UPI003D1C0F56
MKKIILFLILISMLLQGKEASLKDIEYRGKKNLAYLKGKRFTFTGRAVNGREERNYRRGKKHGKQLYFGIKFTGTIKTENSFHDDPERIAYIEAILFGNFLDDETTVVFGESYYENGIINGVAKTYCNEVLIEETCYVNGKQNGLEKIFDFETGKLIKTSEYKNGKKEGTMLEYHDNGKIYKIAQYRNDKSNGEELRFDKNGKEISRKMYIDGEEVK